MAEADRLFTSEERRFLFELALLGLTAGCKLEGLVFSLALETLDHREPYARIARAIGHLQFDQVDEAEAILSSPEVLHSDHAAYAAGLRSMIAHIQGDRSQVTEIAESLENSGSRPDIVEMARQILKS
jgi:hypothetical protein